jgi:molecular chaperone GrpE
VTGTNPEPDTPAPGGGAPDEPVAAATGGDGPVGGPQGDPVGASPSAGDPGVAEVSVEQLTAERDEYLDALVRVKAEFDNYKKRMARERETLGAQVSARLVGELLTVLDACEAAIVQGSDDVDPIYKSLLELLGKEGLEVMPSSGIPFDPHQHEAVTHEQADDGSETMVVDTLRTGYVWQGTVLRPAMVRVRG